MAKKRKSWQEKLADSKGLPKVTRKMHNFQPDFTSLLAENSRISSPLNLIKVSIS